MAKKSTAVAKAAKNSEVDLFDDGSATGFEFVQQKDLIVPQLKIAQKMSEEVDKDEAKFIKGLEVGQIFDGSTNTIYEDGVTLIPVSFRTNYIEWGANRTGFIQDFGDDDSCLKSCTLTPDQKNPKRKRWLTDSGNEIVEHAEWFCINVTDNNKQAFLSMSVTQLGPSRKWLNSAKGEKLKRSDGTLVQAPLWYRSWKAETATDSNDSGTWSIWRFSPDETILELDPSKQLLAAAKEFNTFISEGKIKGDNGPVAEKQKEEAEAM